MGAIEGLIPCEVLEVMQGFMQDLRRLRCPFILFSVLFCFVSFSGEIHII